MDYARAVVAGVLSAGVIVAIVTRNEWDTDLALIMGIAILVLLVPDMLRAYHRAKNKEDE